MTARISGLKGYGRRFDMRRPGFGITRLAIMASMLWAGSAEAQQPAGSARTLPFNATLSNIAPLAFGMAASDAVRRPWCAAAISAWPTRRRNLPGVSQRRRLFFPRQDRLFLQFRKGRLTGWKGDLGHNWMWQ